MIDVMVLPNDDLPLLAAGEPPTITNMRAWRALVDTGASCTCVSSRLAKECGLLPIGKSEMVSASERKMVNRYLFALGMPIAQKVDPSGMVTGSLSVFENIEGMEFNEDGGSFDVLLGMDVISKGSLSLDFDGHFTFCW